RALSAGEDDALHGRDATSSQWGAMRTSVASSPANVTINRIGGRYALAVDGPSRVCKESVRGGPVRGRTAHRTAATGRPRGRGQRPAPARAATRSLHARATSADRRAPRLGADAPRAD